MPGVQRLVGREALRPDLGRRAARIGRGFPETAERHLYRTQQRRTVRQHALRRDDRDSRRRLRDRRQLLGVGRLSGPQGLRLQHRLLARPPERDLEQGVRTDSELQQTAEKHPGQAGALHGTQLRHHPGRGAGLARDAAFRHAAAFRTGLFAQSRRDVHSLLRGRDADARSPAAGQPGRLQGSPGPHGGARGPAQRSRDHRRDADEQRGQRFQFPALPPCGSTITPFRPCWRG